MPRTRRSSSARGSVRRGTNVTPADTFSDTDVSVASEFNAAEAAAAGAAESGPAASAVHSTPQGKRRRKESSDESGQEFHDAQHDMPLNGKGDDSSDSSVDSREMYRGEAPPPLPIDDGSDIDGGGDSDGGNSDESERNKSNTNKSNTITVLAKALIFPNGARVPTSSKTVSVLVPSDQDLDSIKVKLRLDYKPKTSKGQNKLTEDDFILPNLGQVFADSLNLDSDLQAVEAEVSKQLLVKNQVLDKVRDPGRYLMMRVGDFVGKRATKAGEMVPFSLPPGDNLYSLGLRKFKLGVGDYVTDEDGPRILDYVILDLLAFSKPRPADPSEGDGGQPQEEAGQRSSQQSGNTRRISNSRNTSLEMLSVSLLPPTVKIDSDGTYELAAAQPVVAEFHVSVGDEFRLGHLRAAVIKEAIRRPNYKGKVGQSSSLYYSGSAKSKQVAQLLNSTDLFSRIKDKDIDCDGVAPIRLSLGHRKDEDLELDDDHDFDTDDDDDEQRNYSQNPELMSSPMAKQAVLTAQQSRNASQSSGTVVRRWLQSLYTKDHPSNPYFNSFNIFMRSALESHFSAEKYGSGANRDAWDFFDLDQNKFPTVAEGPDWSDPSWQGYDNSWAFPKSREDFVRGAFKPVDPRDPMPPSVDKPPSEAPGDASDGLLGISVRDVLNHRGLTQPQAIAIHALAKAATSPVPPSATSAVGGKSENFSVIFTRKNNTNAKSTVPVVRNKMATTTLKDVVAWSIANDRNSGVFNISKDTGGGDGVPKTELAVSCGGAMWRLKSRSFQVTKVGDVRANHGGGDDKEFVLEVKEVHEEDAAPDLADLMGDFAAERGSTTAGA